MRLTKSFINTFIIYIVCAIVSLLEIGTAKANEMPEIVDRILPTVVTISTEKLVNNQRYYGSVGSGVIYDGENGYIVTNTHILKDAASVKVILKDGQEYEADILGKDDYMDVAVIKITPRKILPQAYLYLGIPKKDAQVFAIGSPNGESNTITCGKITADSLKEFVHENIAYFAIPTDASLEHGSSGGGLFDAHGRLVAITSAKAGNQGYGIPVLYIKDVLMFLEQRRTYEPPVSIDTYQDEQGRIIVADVNINHADLRFEVLQALREKVKPGTEIVSCEFVARDGAKHKYFTTSLEFKYYSQYSPLRQAVQFYVQSDEENLVKIPNRKYPENMLLFSEWRKRIKLE